jgi:uncharacterized ion transporter superfamily protein YfcC
LILDTVGGIEDIICYAFCKMLSVCDIYVYKTKVRNSPSISCLKSRIKENTGKYPTYYGEGSRNSNVGLMKVR